MPNKYRAQKTTVDGITFASRKEAARYGYLLLLQRAKQISELEIQPPYQMVINGVKVCTYIGDFAYVDNGCHVCEDVKGMRTPVYRLKRKLFNALYPTIEHREV